MFRRRRVWGITTTAAAATTSTTGKEIVNDTEILNVKEIKSGSHEEERMNEEVNDDIITVVGEVMQIPGNDINGMVLVGREQEDNDILI